MHRFRPWEVVEILQSARVDPRNPAAGQVFECFKARWLWWARRDYPGLADEHDDAVQEARILVLAHIHELREPGCVEAWANSVFRSVLRELFEKHGRKARRERKVRSGEDPDEILDRLGSSHRSAEEEVRDRERRRMVREVIRIDEVAWSRFEEELTEKEIEERTGLSRNAIATRLKRIRRVLRWLLKNDGDLRNPASVARIVDGTGFSLEVRKKLTEVLERLGHPNANGSSDEDDEDD